MRSLLNELERGARGNLKARLARQELTIGTWITLAHPAVAEIMGRAGFDWVVIDTEHSVIDTSDIQPLLQALDATGCPALVRLTSNHPDQVKRAMDAGATGIMVPMVASAAQAQAAVDAVYYPPRGQRGVGLARAQAYGAGFRDYVEWLERNAVVIAMIEHVDAIDRMDEILGVTGIDGFIIGPYDLSASMGKPGEFDDAEVIAAITAIRDGGVAAGKPGGLHVVEPDWPLLRRHIDSGFRFLGYGVDIRILDAVCRRDLAAIRMPDA
jgi:2-dehydro-3-deoxyglucarate aldolase